jgi:hypothetical protein
VECWKAAGDHLTNVINICPLFMFVHCFHSSGDSFCLERSTFFYSTKSEEAGCCKLSKVVEGRVNDRQAVARDPLLLLGAILLVL